MEVFRQPPVNDCKPKFEGFSNVGPFDVTFGIYLESDPPRPESINVVLELIKQNERGFEKTEKLTLVMSPAEVLLLLATIPSEHIAGAMRQFADSTKRETRDGSTLPHCAINAKEFADKLVELFRSTLDWK